MQTTLWILGRSHSFQVQPKRSRQLSTLFPIPLLWVHPVHLWKLLNIKTEHGTRAPSMLFALFVGNPLQHLLQTHSWVLKIYPEGCWGSSPGSFFFLNDKGRLFLFLLLQGRKWFWCQIQVNPSMFQGFSDWTLSFYASVMVMTILPEEYHGFFFNNKELVWFWQRLCIV